MIERICRQLANDPETPVNVQLVLVSAAEEIEHLSRSKKEDLGLLAAIIAQNGGELSVDDREIMNIHQNDRIESVHDKANRRWLFRLVRD